jgi:glucose-1-phosphate thymidylyltransferase
MIAVILCAGFATRMYPLTENLPKPLLTVADRPVIDYLMDQMADLPQVQAIHIVSNAKFFGHFLNWQSSLAAGGTVDATTVRVHNDGATANENRLGAAADLQLVLKTITRPSKVLVSAGDNIYRFSIKPLWEKFLQSDHHHVVALPETDGQKLKRTGVLELGKNDRILRLHEKPQSPPSTWTCPPLYFFQASVGPQLDSFLKTSEDCDAPGHFIDYLCRREPVHAFRLHSTRLDIGSIDTYQQANRILRQNPI